ncbi:MAG TPA: hypothetical protein VFI37_16940 [Gaiellaceae bacterium]|nr:hypothetical protein [Gaiellaceae bacterium]
MRITRQLQVRACAICERTLLMGERPTRFAPEGGSGLVEVCPLCVETALDHGWLKEGSPTTPTVADGRRRRRRPLLAMLGARPRPSEEPVLSEPILRRLSEAELSIVEAADVFNGSQYRRTVEGIAKSLGEPQVSIVPLSGVNPEVVITVCWDISWYQYRVSPESAQQVRLEQRGHDADELEASVLAWNARLDETGRVVPAIDRL